MLQNEDNMIISLSFHALHRFGNHLLQRLKCLSKCPNLITRRPHNVADYKPRSHLAGDWGMLGDIDSLD